MPRRRRARWYVHLSGQRDSGDLECETVGAGQHFESVVQVEPGRSLVQGVYHDECRCDGGSGCSGYLECLGEKDAAELPAVQALVKGKASDEGSRDPIWVSVAERLRQVAASYQA